jgi:hypothetical protein
MTDSFTGTNGQILTSSDYNNFDGGIETLTEHTIDPSNPSPNWCMTLGELQVQNNQGWTGRAKDLGKASHFRLRSLTQKALNFDIDFDYKVASWASGTYGTNATADGTAVWGRYITQWGALYEVYIDKYDNKVSCKRKVPAIGYTGSASVNNEGVYYTLWSDAQCPVIGAGTLQGTYTSVGSTNLVRDATDGTGASGTSYHFKVTFRTIATNQVQAQLFRNGVLVWSCTDNNNDCTNDATGVSLANELANNRYNTSDSRWDPNTMAKPIQTTGHFGFRCVNSQAFFDNVSVVSY